MNLAIRRRLWARLVFAQSDGNFLLVLVANNRKFYFRAGKSAGDLVAQSIAVADGFTVEGHNNIAAPNARLRRRTVLRHRVDENAARFAKPKLLCQFGCPRLNADTELPAMHLASLDQLRSEERRVG